MIKSTFDIDAVAQAVGMWILGFWTDGTHPVSVGDGAEYRLRCTRNEMIEDFAVKVTAVSSEEAEVLIEDVSGRSVTMRMPVGDDGVLGSLGGTMVPVAVEGLPVDGGVHEYTVYMFRGRRSGMAWVREGIAYRTIHDAGGFRLCFDLAGSSIRG